MINRYNNTNNNKRYYTLDYYYKNKYKNKIAKISLNGGFTCPNKDGSRGTGGCIYCSKLGSGDFAGSLRNSLIEQFYEVKEKMDMKWPGCFYIGYFQANTNTYAKVDVLKQKYEPILELDKVVEDYDCVVGHRGLGLMQGIVLNVPAKKYVQALLDEGVIVVTAGEKVIRLLPPLVITKEHVDEFITKLRKVLA